MKSESSEKMMLRYIFIFGLVSLALAQSTANTNKSIKKPSEIKYTKSPSYDLKKQQFQSTKERPELDPAVSMAISEDIKKSIDAKRHAEYDLTPLSEVSTVAQTTTVAPVQTTVRYIPKAQDDSVVVDSIAGSSSEKKQQTTTEELTTIEALTTTTTTTSTTEAPTTTSTTTTEAPALINGRRTPFGAGRRNPLKSRSKPTEAKVIAEVPKESTSAETSAQAKPKNRFSRPSFNARSRPTPTAAAATTSADEEEVVKQKAKPIAAAARGRTRNRFNLRSSTPGSVSSDEKNPDENAIDASAQSTSTQRPLRTRPTFNVRGRSRASLSSTAPPSDGSVTEQAIAETKLESEEKPSTGAPSKPSSRFNLQRPNQLLSPRGRVSPFAKTPAPSAEQSAESGNVTDAISSTPTTDLSKESIADEEQIAAEPSTTPQTGLNRLRNRPRIQIQPKAPSTNKLPTATSYINANRKANPLISRRKIGSSTTTEETLATETNEASDELKEPQSESKEISSAENEGNAKEEASPFVEASSEQPRGLGLLANRRRLAVRRPGTIL